MLNWSNESGNRAKKAMESRMDGERNSMEGGGYKQDPNDAAPIRGRVSNKEDRHVHVLPIHVSSHAA